MKHARRSHKPFQVLPTALVYIYIYIYVCVCDTAPALVPFRLNIALFGSGARCERPHSGHRTSRSHGSDCYSERRTGATVVRMGGVSVHEVDTRQTSWTSSYPRRCHPGEGTGEGGGRTWAPQGGGEGGGKDTGGCAWTPEGEGGWTGGGCPSLLPGGVWGEGMCDL